MLKDTAARAIRKFPITYYADGVESSDFMKVDPLKMEVARKTAKYNRMGVTLPNTPISVGNLVDFGSHKYIVGSKIPDVYRGDIIRQSCELFHCEDVYTITRVETAEDDFGNIIGEEAAVVVCENIWGSVNASDVFAKGDRDVITEYLNFWYSIEETGVLIGDRVDFHGIVYEIKFFRHETPGINLARLERVAV